MKAQSLHHQSQVEGRLNQRHGLAGVGPEFGGQFHDRPGVGHAQAQHHAGVGSEPLDFLQLVGVVERHQRLVLIEGLQRFAGLGRIGVNDFVPDEILLLLGGQPLDVLVHQPEFRQRRHVEAGPDLVEAAHDGRIGVGLDGVVGLDPGQVLMEGCVVGADDVVINHHHRRALFARDLL